MKGGNYLALEAIRQLTAIDAQTPLPITVLFTSDEEIGSPYTRDLIEAEARTRCRCFGAGTSTSRERGHLWTPCCCAL